MAVILCSENAQKYRGLSTDTKPTDARAGAEFTETNTGVKWFYDGTNWQEDLTLIYALSQVLGG